MKLISPTKSDPSALSMSRERRPEGGHVATHEWHIEEWDPAHRTVPPSRSPREYTRNTDRRKSREGLANGSPTPDSGAAASRNAHRSGVQGSLSALARVSGDREHRRLLRSEHLRGRALALGSPWWVRRLHQPGGSAGFNDGYIYELAPKESSFPIKHIYDELVFVLRAEEPARFGMTKRRSRPSNGEKAVTLPFLPTPGTSGTTSQVTSPPGTSR